MCVTLKSHPFDLDKLHSAAFIPISISVEKNEQQPVSLFSSEGGPGRVVNGAFMVLKGHRSIVNQVRFNPHTYMICSSGVEKVIKVSQPLPGVRPSSVLSVSAYVSVLDTPIDAPVLPPLTCGPVYNLNSLSTLSHPLSRLGVDLLNKLAQFTSW